MRTISYLLSLLILGQSVKGQPIADGQGGKWRIDIGVIGSRASVIDKSFSSIPYKGLQGGSQAALSLRKGLATHELAAAWSTGTLKTDPGPAGSLSQDYFTAGYTTLYELGSRHTAGGLRPEAQGWEFRAGGSLNFFYADRKYQGFINNNTSYEWAASLSAAGKAAYTFDGGLSGFTLSDRLSIPLLSWLRQPAFGGESGQKNDKAVSVSSFLRIYNCLRMEKEIGSSQAISLGYNWDFYRVQGLQEVRQAVHELLLTYSFNL